MEHKHKKILYGVHRQSSSGSLEVKLPKALTMSFFAKKMYMYIEVATMR